MGLRPHPVWSPVGAVGARLLRPGKPEYQAGNTTLNFPSLPVGQRLCSLRPARFVRWHGLEHRGFRKLTQPPLHTKLSGRITDIGQLITSPGSLYPTAIHNHRAALNRVEQGQYLIARRAIACTVIEEPGYLAVTAGQCHRLPGFEAGRQMLRPAQVSGLLLPLFKLGLFLSCSLQLPDPQA